MGNGTIFTDEELAKIESGTKNPMVYRYGKGPDGVRCKRCEHHFFRQGGSRRYGKCKIRGVTGGAGTDHPQHWQACAIYETKKCILCGEPLGYNRRKYCSSKCENTAKIEYGKMYRKYRDNEQKERDAECKRAYQKRIRQNKKTTKGTK